MVQQTLKQKKMSDAMKRPLNTGASEPVSSRTHSSSKKRKLEQTTIDMPVAKKNLSLPCPHSADNPDAYLEELVFAIIGEKLQATPATSLTDFFSAPTPEQQAGYTLDVVSAARNNNVERLRELRDSGSKMSCFNRFGESLLHMACRRGFSEMAEFLLNDPEVETRIVDDCGRTPMHDTCWASVPKLDVALWIIEREPSLLFVADKRGFTPFSYTRPEHWNMWKQFLYDNRHCLERLDVETYSSFRCHQR